MDILLIEDNLTITKALTYTFETNGLTVKTVNNLTDAYDLTLAHYKLILLDVSLPDGGGFDFYKDMLSNKNIPTIFLTAKSLEDDVVKGLNLGAVDYITKPFSTRVLLAKINKYIKKENVVKVKNITFDFDKMEVYNEGNLVNLTSLEIKKKLAELTNDKGIVEAIKSNKRSPKALTGDIEIESIPFVDKKITIGIELECVNDYNDAYISIKNLLSRWIMKEEATVLNGVEITSPVLNYNVNSLRELKYVCQFLQRNNFSVNENCGGHIHIGFDYFDDISQIQMLYYLYVYCEDAISLMVNRCGSTIRPCALTNARSIKDMMIKAFGKYMSFIDLSISDFVMKMQELQHDKYTSINLQNALSKDKNTIEFRIPNGEIDFEEINYNIIFFTRLIYLAKTLTTCKIDERTMQKIISLSDNLPLSDKRDILLDLMFSEIDLKNVYFDRFESNYELNRDIGQKL